MAIYLQHLNVTWSLDPERVSRTLELISPAMCAQSVLLDFPMSPLSDEILRQLSRAPQLPAQAALTELKTSSITVQCA